VIVTLSNAETIERERRRLEVRRHELLRMLDETQAFIDELEAQEMLIRARLIAQVN